MSPLFQDGWTAGFLAGVGMLLLFLCAWQERTCIYARTIRPLRCRRLHPRLLSKPSERVGNTLSAVWCPLCGLELRMMVVLDENPTREQYARVVQEMQRLQAEVRRSQRVGAIRWPLGR